MRLRTLTPTDPKWEHIDAIIEKWLDDRQELIILFNNLCHLKPFKSLDATLPVLEPFCQLLVDYVSAGQFEVFEKIFEASERNDAPTFDKKLLMALLKTTMDALDFNDKYTDNTDLGDLPDDLSFLGERIATRLELEDQLIELYMQATQNLTS